MSEPSPEPAAPRPHPPTRPRAKGSKWIGRSFIILWVALVVAVYIVIVKLKINGERALRLPEDPAKQSAPGQPQTPAPTPTADGDGPAE